MQFLSICGLLFGSDNLNKRKYHNCCLMLWINMYTHSILWSQATAKYYVIIKLMISQKSLISSVPIIGYIDFMHFCSYEYWWKFVTKFWNLNWYTTHFASNKNWSNKLFSLVVYSSLLVIWIFILFFLQLNNLRI